MADDLDPLSFFLKKDAVAAVASAPVPAVSDAPRATQPSFSERRHQREKEAAEMAATMPQVRPETISRLSSTAAEAKKSRQSASRAPKESDIGPSNEPSVDASVDQAEEEQELPAENWSEDTLEEDIAKLTGETYLMKLKNIAILKPSGRQLPITLVMTTYRMMLVPSRLTALGLAGNNPSVISQLTIPLGCIAKIEKEKKPKDSRSTGVTIVVQCKDIRCFRLYITGPSEQNVLDGPVVSESEIERAFGAMIAYSFPTDIRHVFAFSHLNHMSVVQKAQSVLDSYDFAAEFVRQGVITENYETPPNGHWRLSTMNWEYRLCDTYPRQLIVPVKTTDDDLIVVSHFRSGQRLPALTWGKPGSAASIWRSSQPKSGVASTCPQDEAMLDAIAQARGIRVNTLGVLTRNLGEAMLAIIDCRPRSNALANRAAGAGYELQKSYPNTRLEFYDIPNIHAVRDSFRSITSLFQTYNGVHLSNQGAVNPAATQSIAETNFGKVVEDTQWLGNIRLLLRASWECAHIVQRGTPVLVHCSHGWDRTSQVCAIAQLFLDSYYRTFEGFQVLVEKDWVSFGHPFLMRCGHLLNHKEDDVSPIFLQFLDCVYQLVRQFPHFFEFNTRYVLALADQIHSCRFGTFLMNCDADRDRYGTRQKTRDVWGFLWDNRATLKNPLYCAPSLDRSTTTHILLPPLTIILRNVVLWTDYFYRWSAEASSVPLPEHITKEILSSSDRIFIKDDTESPGREVCDPDSRMGPTMTSTDFWEHMYRMERRKRREAEKRCGMDCSDDDDEQQNQYDGEDGSADIGAVEVVENPDVNRRLSMRRDRKSSADEFAEWNSCLNDTSLSPSAMCSTTNVESDAELTLPPKMIDIDGSDDETDCQSSQWWTGEGFKTELRSRTHKEIADLAVHLMEKLDTQGIDITPELSLFLRRQNESGLETKEDSTAFATV